MTNTIQSLLKKYDISSCSIRGRNFLSFSCVKWGDSDDPLEPKDIAVFFTTTTGQKKINGQPLNSTQARPYIAAEFFYLRKDG